MKKGDIEVGAEYAVTAGTSSFDQNLRGARRAEVLEVGVEYTAVGWRGARRSDGVRVRWLDNLTSRYPARWRAAKECEGTEEGEIGIVPTRWIWRPWSEIEEATKRHEEEVAERRAELEAREAKADAVRAKADALGVGEFRVIDGLPPTVTMNLATFEALLERVS